MKDVKTEASQHHKNNGHPFSSNSNGRKGCCSNKTLEISNITPRRSTTPGSIGSSRPISPRTSKTMAMTTSNYITKPSSQNPNPKITRSCTMSSTSPAREQNVRTIKSDSVPTSPTRSVRILQRQLALSSKDSLLLNDEVPKDEKSCPPSSAKSKRNKDEIIIPTMKLMSTSSLSSKRNNFPLRKNKVTVAAASSQITTTTSSTTQYGHIVGCCSKPKRHYDLHTRGDPDGGCDYNYNNITTTNRNTTDHDVANSTHLLLDQIANNNNSHAIINSNNANADRTKQKSNPKYNVTMTEKLATVIGRGQSCSSNVAKTMCQGYVGANAVSKTSPISSFRTTAKRQTPKPLNDVQLTKKSAQKSIGPSSSIIRSNSNTIKETDTRKLINRENTFVHGKAQKRTNNNQEDNVVETILTKKQVLNTSSSKMGSIHGTYDASVRKQQKQNLVEKEMKPNDDFNPKEEEHEDEELEFLIPLQPRMEVSEGNDLELQVRLKGAKRVIWVKDDKIVPNIPPDFEYKSNPVDGIYGLKVRDVYAKDSGIYICEAYGQDERSDAICWSRVEITDGCSSCGEDEEDNTSIETLSEIEQTSSTSPAASNSKREFIVPLIITSDASAEETSTTTTKVSMELEMEQHDKGENNAVDKRLLYREMSTNSSSANSSKDVFEDALDELIVNEKTGKISPNESMEDVEINRNVYSIPPTIASPVKISHITNSSNEIQVEATLSPSLLSDITKRSAEMSYSPTSDTMSPPFSNITQYSTDMSISPIISDTIMSPPSFSQEDHVLGTGLIHINKSNDDKVNDLESAKSTSIMDVNRPKKSTLEEQGEDEDVVSLPQQKSLRSQSSTESVESEVGGGSSGSSFDCSSSVNGGLGRFRDSLSSDNPLAPKFIMGPENFIALLGETVNLRVKIWTSVDETTVTWSKLVRGVYKRIENSTNSHIHISQPTNDLITMRIDNATYEDCGKYQVKVENPHGKDFHYCLLSVEGPPEPPPVAPIATFDELNNSILVSWPCCPFDGGSALSGYRLEMKISTSDDWIILTDSNFKGLCFVVKHPVSSSISYVFRVCAENSHGSGKYSLISEPFHVPKDTDSSSRCSSTSTNPQGSLSFDNESPYEYNDVVLKQKEFLLDYDKHEQLGKGRFGVVFKVTNKETDKSYAGKFVKCRKAADKERTQLEYKIMNDLKFHPKLICLVDAYEMPREIVIVTEMIVGGELFEKVVADDFTLTERDCVAFLRQICNGVRYIHEKNIMHLDLKPENILCTQKTSNQIKIIDFGLAQYYNPKEPIRVLFGTAEFVSPEIINYETICPATDQWSVGVITYILLSGLSPFLGDDDNETFNNITRGEFDFDDEAFDKISEDAKDFISCLILKRKEKRLTAEECLKHKWLALSDAEKKDIVLPTDKLKRFLLRRKWQKTGNAIRALGRITTLYSTSRRSSSGTSTSSSPMTPFGISRSLSKDSTTECDSVFSSMDVESTSSSNPRKNTTNSNNTSVNDDNNKPKYDGSDSGVCDVVNTNNNSTIKNVFKSSNSNNL